MGSCLSSSEDPVAEKRTKEIEKSLKRDEELMRNQVKCLLLGAGDSGKSTVLKQMRFIYDGNKLTTGEIEEYRQRVYLNLVVGMRLIVDMMDIWLYPVADENRKYVTEVDKARPLNDNEAFPSSIFTALDSLWKDPGVKKAWKRCNEAAMQENLPYFFDRLEIIFSDGYTPTEDDIVRTRIKTSGISETQFEIGKTMLRVFDVGGQRSERRKWINCFENVNAVIFIVSLAAFDTSLVEDIESNAMQEAFMLADTVFNSVWFKKSSLILFLNKNDLFVAKLSLPEHDRPSIRDFFPNYDGAPNDHEYARLWFRKKFVSLLKDDRKIYTHTTTAIDKKGLQVVTSAVTDSIIRQTLQDVNLL